MSAPAEMAAMDDLRALLPCPFCGKSNARPLGIRDGTEVTCPDCFASGPPAFAPQSRNGAIVGWNTRAAIAARKGEG